MARCAKARAGCTATVCPRTRSPTSAKCRITRASSNGNGIDGSRNPSPPSGLVPVHTHLQLCIIIIIIIINYWICLRPRLLVRSSVIPLTYQHKILTFFFFACYVILNLLQLLCRPCKESSYNYIADWMYCHEVIQNSIINIVYKLLY